MIDAGPSLRAAEIPVARMSGAFAVVAACENSRVPRNPGLPRRASSADAAAARVGCWLPGHKAAMVVAMQAKSMSRRDVLGTFLRNTSEPRSPGERVVWACGRLGGR